MLLAACNKNMSYDEYVSYVNNPKNGLIQEKTVNGTTIKLTYKPTQMMVQQELERIDSLTNEIKESIQGKYADKHYLTLSFSQNSKEILSSNSNRQQFSQLVNQFAFNMGNQVLLTTETRDTLQLLDFHYPRLYGMAPSTNIIFVFEREKEPSKELLLTVSEFGLRTGNIRFKLKTPKKFNQ